MVYYYNLDLLCFIIIIRTKWVITIIANIFAIVGLIIEEKVIILHFNYFKHNFIKQLARYYFILNSAFNSSFIIVGIIIVNLELLAIKKLRVYIYIN